MKNRKIKVLINILILISISLILNNDLILINNKQIIKEMSESTQVSNLNSSIDRLNTEHDEYKRYIENSKAQIAQALRNEGVQTEDTASFETITGNISKVLQARTKNATATADNITEGKTAWVNGQLITGNGADNTNTSKTITVTLTNTSNASGTLQTIDTSTCTSNATGTYVFTNVQSYTKISGTATASLSAGTLTIKTSASKTNTGPYARASTSTQVKYSITFK